MALLNIQLISEVPIAYQMPKIGNWKVPKIASSNKAELLQL